MTELQELRKLIGKTIDIASSQNTKLAQIVNAQYDLLKGLSKALTKLQEIEQHNN